MRRTLPFLRTPPFPGTEPRVVAISEVVDAGTEADRIDIDRAARLFALIADAQIGGAFWNEDEDPWRLPVERFVALDGDDERVAVGLLRGLPLSIARAGAFGDPAGGPDRAALAEHLLRRCRYRDPFTDATIPAEAAVALLAQWRAGIAANRGIVVATGIAWWKRREMRAMLWPGTAALPRFVRGDRAAARQARRRGGAVAAWPSRVGRGLAAATRAAAVPLIRVEDGFIRSVGLGSGLHPPYSIIVDRTGIHYDPAGRSDLETLLATADFSPDLLARARALREAVVARGISKYNEASRPPSFPPRRPGRRLVLVTGQVSDDLSVLRGGAGVAGNLDLLARARAVEPEADLWFRPHPDVDAGHRRGAIADAEALRHADRVIRGGSMAALLDHVDGVHVLTSLAGFEALLRGRDVTTHGQPFYAGWGLTRDLAPPLARRGRPLTLDQLICATLLLYPRYLDPVTLLPCSAEQLVTRVSGALRPRRPWLLRARAVQGRLLRLLR
ncbi:capsular polysaccharide export protein, LipB/KpsS family [Sphingomonas morindae]|uniref:Beta-3-deoxy-D-manno-oct-2-ulosonic acid transferase n=1 Tax=Sphingomonas morindae TaxID=1541170 RepID=A0ABY4X669_9SPHN|nr:beta-3-deoxy-D-manno-oct-2-ulosonic acid transferase [Sphingomonas morindae]USI72371.1 beta-3-deoxy-D-manno-oct-2-ulosonic acid transferase [Sphingomonas morindae]